MKDYFTITNEDNMELMARYPDNYFDLAIVDPPYGIGIAKNGKLHNHSKFEKGFKKTSKFKPTNWDDEIPTEDYFNELKRVSKNQIIFGGNYFLDYLGYLKCFIVWYKKGADRNPNFSPMELAWTSLKKLPVHYDIPWLGFGYINSGEKKIHPTQKPALLYGNILKDFAKPNDKILDTHLGSGSIAIALDSVNKIEKMNLTLTACELDADYYQTATKRIEEQTKWNSLF